MESKEYRLEEYSGEIYTQEEFLDKYSKDITTDIIEIEWEKLKPIPTEGLDIEDLRNRMRYIYCKGSPLVKGDIIKVDVKTRYFAYVEYACGRIMVRHSNEISGEIEEWKGKYVKLGTYTSFIDACKPHQIAYNVMMNQLRK